MTTLANSVLEHLDDLEAPAVFNYVSEHRELDENVMALLSSLASKLRRAVGNPVIDSVDTNASALACKKAFISVEGDKVTIFGGDIVKDVLKDGKYYDFNKQSRNGLKVLFVDKILADIKAGALKLKVIATDKFDKLTPDAIISHIQKI